MHALEPKILEKLGISNLTKEAAIQQLTNITEQFPNFAIAHLILARHLKANNSSAYQQQAQKTALFFPNIFWLKFQLENTFENSKFSTLPALQGFHFDHIKQEKETIPVNITQSTDDSVYVKDEVDENATETEAIVDSKIGKILEQQLANFNKPVDANTELVIENEPFHTIDYFGSQGIKPTKIEQASIANLEHKVHKFTDWLKQMKRISSSPTDLGTTIEAEKLVSNIAEKSNKIDDIITEAMAAVYVKQGRIDKAINTYEKLSFLNPEKSIYFANQIKILKEKL